jgi:hypothetical protein
MMKRRCDRESIVSHTEIQRIIHAFGAITFTISKNFLFKLLDSFK